MIAADAVKDPTLWDTAQPFFLAALPSVLLAIAWISTGSWRKDVRARFSADLTIAKELPDSPTKADLLARIDRDIRQYYELDRDDAAGPPSILAGPAAGFVAVSTLFLTTLFILAYLQTQPSGLTQWLAAVVAFGIPVITAISTLIAGLIGRGSRSTPSHRRVDERQND